MYQVLYLHIYHVNYQAVLKQCLPVEVFQIRISMDPQCIFIKKIARVFCLILNASCLTVHTAGRNFLFIYRFIESWFGEAMG